MTVIIPNPDGVFTEINGHPVTARNVEQCTHPDTVILKDEPPESPNQNIKPVRSKNNYMIKTVCRWCNTTLWRGPRFGLKPVISLYKYTEVSPMLTGKPKHLHPNLIN